MVSITVATPEIMLINWLNPVRNGYLRDTPVINTSFRSAERLLLQQALDIS